MGKGEVEPKAGRSRTNASVSLSTVVIPYCLVYLKSRGKVLLIRKSEGRSHEGQWIGLGGKLLIGEDPVSSAVREFREESGLNLEDPKLRGTLIWIDEAQCGIVHIVTGPNGVECWQSPTKVRLVGTISKIWQHWTVWPVINVCF